MATPAARLADPQDVNSVALELLCNLGARRWDAADASLVREWIERRLGDAGRKPKEMSGIELHREIEAGIPGKSIPILLAVLEMTKEDFSAFLGRARKTLNELAGRKRLSRTDSDLLYRLSRALVHAASVFEDAGYAVRWLKDSNEALGGMRPLSLLATVEGDELVHAELGAIEHGLPV